MTCAELKELLAAYALDALEPHERAVCDAHLRSPGPHEGCADELERARAAVALIGAALPPVKPGRGVWSAIERGLAAGERARARGSALLVLFGLVAAVAVLLLFVLFRARTSVLEARLAKSEHDLVAARGAQAAWQSCRGELESIRSELDARRAALALLDRPATQLVTLRAPGGLPMHGSALVNRAERRGYVLASDLKAEAGKDYELWVIRGQDKIAAGILTPGTDGIALAKIEPGELARGLDALAITVEPTGGLPHPTGPIVLVGAMPKG